MTHKSLGPRVDSARRHGAPLARDHGGVTVSFDFEWGVVSRIERQDDLRTVVVLREQHAHRTTLAERDPTWVEQRLIETVGDKARKAHRVRPCHPLWLIVRNPYTHLAGVSEAARREALAANAGLFERV